MKKLIALFLLLSTIVLSLASCGSDDDNGGNSGGGNITIEGEGDEMFAGVDFDGESITLGVRGSGTKYMTCLDSDGKAITDDSIIAQVKQRNDYIQGRLNLEVDYYNLPGANSGSNMWDTYIALYNANDGFADAMIYNVDVMMHLMMSGIFRNGLDDTRDNYFDFTDDSWMSEAMVSASLEEDLSSKVFLLCNDYFISTIAMVEVVFVNETIYNDTLGSEDAIVDFQNQVLDGNWTYDDMNSLAKRTYINNGSDANKIDKDDQLGIVMKTNPSVQFTYSSTNKYIEKTSDGYKYTSNITSLSRLVDKALTVYNSKGTYHASSDTDILETYEKGKTLFYIGGYMRDLERDYFSHLKCVTIPYPKVSVEDEYSVLAGSGTIVGAILKTGDFTPVSAYWQYSGMKSETAKIKYYKDGLGLKYETGTNTLKLIDLICNSTTFNRTFYWDLYIKSATTSADSVSNVMGKSLESGQNKVASLWETTLSMKNQALAAAYKTWKGL